MLIIAFAACSQEQDPSRQFPLSPSLNEAGAVAGQVYTMTNQAAGNAVLVYDRAVDGTLTTAGSYTTGGLGNGGGLGSQGSVTLDEAATTLAVVNAGSNDVSVFRVRGDGGLDLTDRVASGGTTPISVTIGRGLLYVLNAGGSANISGFRLSPDGHLTSIPGSSRPLSTASPAPAQVAFDPTGRRLIVTEKGTKRITTFTVDDDGVASGPIVTASSGTTPFGFGVTRQGTLVVSEAFGGAPGASAVSSYAPGSAGTWTAISPSVATTETSACWIAIAHGDRFAYSANTGSGTVSGFAIQQGGLTPLDADGVTGDIGAGTAPADMAVSRDSRYLYVRAGGSHQIASFSIAADGSLTPLAGWVNGLPSADNGLAAR